MSAITQCRSCGSTHLLPLLDLGRQPLANALVDLDRIDQPEDLFPLEVCFCTGCALVQVTETVPPEVLFGRDYPYFSSFSPALLAHSRAHALDLVERRTLGPGTLVAEVASNDGYLLRNFAAAGIPVLGIDPASGPAAAARAIGVPTVEDFFNRTLAERLAAEGYKADVILAKNVLAHVDGINEFVAGFAALLKDDGIAEFEFPYLRDLIESCAFDTIYHEHVFYYALTALEPLFGRHGLHLNDVVRLDIHGGSLRLTVSKNPGRTARLQTLMDEERQLGMHEEAYYASFARRVAAVREKLLALVADLRGQGRRIAAYGAAAKGATLLNYAGLTRAQLDFVVDRNTHKVGKAMPGAKLPIRPVEDLLTEKPDHLLILAWNFGREIMEQQRAYADQGGSFILPIPEPHMARPGDNAAVGPVAAE
ncbi:class I SAM-dependent methyltransferase [Oleisolibacter albus]|uniref:class I SAM-dependent methyltransferase n=1 Tax=Oleisolibacter albus TaxID=2171757 RepID=UPI000DF3F917|nr:class I SAM-dependent methyltransferase [Oleisolibacter albus]